MNLIFVRCFGVIFNTIAFASFPFFGQKKAAEYNLDGSFPAFCIYNNGKQRFFTKQRNN